MGSQQIILSASKNSQVCLRAHFQHGLWRERLQGQIRHGGCLGGCGFVNHFLMSLTIAGAWDLILCLSIWTLYLPSLPSFPNIEKYINKFTVAWWTLRLNMQIMSLQLQKSFRFFPLFHFFLLSSPLIAASWPKLQVLAKRPYYWKNSNNSFLYVPPIPPPTWSRAHSVLLVCLNQTWGLPACCATVTLETALSTLQHLSVLGHLCWVASLAHFKVMF